MIRVFIENLLLFLIPTIVYVAYVMMTRATNEGDADTSSPTSAQILNEAPLMWLFAAGAMLVIATLISFGHYSGGKPGELYVPPAMKDGRIEPGHKVKP